MARGSTLANVSASATSVVLFAQAEAVSVRTVHNDSSTQLYLKFGATASVTSFTAKVPPQGYYEFPRPTYDGVVHGIWDSATGSARCTEVA